MEGFAWGKVNVVKVWNVECFTWRNVTVVKHLERGIFYPEEERHRCKSLERGVFHLEKCHRCKSLERGMFYLEECHRCKTSGTWNVLQGGMSPL